MWMRLALAVATMVVFAARGPVTAQVQFDDDPGLEEPDLDEPGLENEEPEAPPAPDDAPQDHGYHHRYDFDGGGDEELPTEPASNPEPRHEGPAQGAPAETAPAAPASPPAAEPASEAPASAAAEY